MTQCAFPVRARLSLLLFHPQQFGAQHGWHRQDTACILCFQLAYLYGVRQVVDDQSALEFQFRFFKVNTLY